MSSGSRRKRLTAAGRAAIVDLLGEMAPYTTLRRAMSPEESRWDKEVWGILSFLARLEGRDPIAAAPTGAELRVRIEPPTKEQAIALETWVEKMKRHYSKRIETMLKEVPPGLRRTAAAYQRMWRRLSGSM